MLLLMLFDVQQSQLHLNYVSWVCCFLSWFQNTSKLLTQLLTCLNEYL